MDTRSDEPRAQALPRLVDERLRLENLHHVDGILETLSAETRFDDEAWNDRRVGRDQVKRYYEELFAAAGDYRIEARNQYVAEEAVVLEAAVNATHTGVWRGLPATGKRVSLPVCVIYAFDSDGRISSERLYYDRASALRQLGVFREPDTGFGRVLIAINHPFTLLRAFVRKIIGR